MCLFLVVFRILLIVFRILLIVFRILIVFSVLLIVRVVRLVVVVAGVMFVLSFDLFGYNRFVPDAEKIKSAGVIDLEDCYFKGKLNAVELGNLAADDCTDAKDIGNITDFHRSIINNFGTADYNPYADIWYNMIMSGVGSTFYDSGYIVSYKLSSGFVSTRCYYENGVSSVNYYDINTGAVDDILGSAEYYLRYSSIMNARYDEIISLGVSVPKDDGDRYDYLINSPIYIEADNNNPTAKADIEKVMTAFRKDFAEHGEVKPNDAVVRIDIRYVKKDNAGGNSFLGAMIAAMSYSASSSGDRGYISEDYTRTLKAMREIGALDDDNNLEIQSWYYQNPYR